MSGESEGSHFGIGAVAFFKKAKNSLHLLVLGRYAISFANLLISPDESMSRREISTIPSASMSASVWFSRPSEKSLLIL